MKRAYLCASAVLYSAFTYPISEGGVLMIVINIPQARVQA